MALPQIISRNQIQKTNLRTLIQQDTSSHPVTYYTCPAGKIAIIQGAWLCSDTGAGGVVDLNAGGISIAEVQASGGGTDPNIPQDLAEGLLFKFVANLSASETLATSQDSGTNANTLIDITIEEFNI